MRYLIVSLLTLFLLSCTQTRPVSEWGKNIHGFEHTGKCADDLTHQAKVAANFCEENGKAIEITKDCRDKAITFYKDVLVKDCGFFQSDRAHNPRNQLGKFNKEYSRLKRFISTEDAIAYCAGNIKDGDCAELMYAAAKVWSKKRPIKTLSPKERGRVKNVFLQSEGVQKKRSVKNWFWQPEDGLLKKESDKKQFWQPEDIGSLFYNRQE